MVKLVNELQFDKEVIGSNVPVVVDFFATWCGPCKMIAPVLDQLAEEFGESACFVKVDVDEDRSLAQRYGIKSMPTLVLIKNGEVVDKVIGALPKDEIKSKIAPMLG